MLHFQGDPNQEAAQWEGTANYQQRCERRPGGGGETEVEEVQREEGVIQVGCFKGPSSETQTESQ